MPRAPFPPDDGGKICSYSFIDNLRDVYEFTVVLPAYDKKQYEQIESQRSKWSNVTIVTIKLFSDEIKINNAHIRVKFYKTLKCLYNILRKMIKLKTITSGYFDYQAILNSFNAIPQFYIDEVCRLVKSKPFDIIQVEYANNLSIINILPHSSKNIYIEIESRSAICEDQTKINSQFSRFFLILSG